MAGIRVKVVQVLRDMAVHSRSEAMSAYNIKCCTRSTNNVSRTFLRRSHRMLAAIERSLARARSFYHGRQYVQLVHDGACSFV